LTVIVMFVECEQYGDGQKSIFSFPSDSDN